MTCLNFLKKVGLCVLILLGLWLIVPRPSLATNLEKSLQSPGVSLESWLAGKELVGGEGSGVLGISVDTAIRYMVGSYNDDGTPLTQGATGSLVAYTQLLYDYQPASTGQYLAYLNNHKLKLVPPAYAQVQSWVLLNPVLMLWETCRNVAYLFFIIIFVAVGFMIMFRSKINPQLVISVQNSIPKIIASLLLITFSYAICGLIIDLAFVGNGLMKTIFSTSAFDTVNVPPSQGLTAWFWQNQPEILGNYINSFGGGVLKNLGQALTKLGGFIVKGDMNSVIQLVIAFSLVGALVKIFFSLLVQYVTLIFGSAISPFVFLTTSLPNQSPGKFIKMMLVAAFTFPLTLFLLNAASYFSIHDVQFHTISPLIFNVSTATPIPGLTATAVTGLNRLVALGLLMAAAQVPSTLQEMFQSKGLAATAGFGEIGGALKKIPVIGSLIG